MKSLPMPVSSPSRAGAENFPPPLMRSLKSDLGSRSRSRSSGRPRASPMLIGKKNSVGVIETTQEPSSPKVTCFGQVSARRSANAKAKNTASHRPWWRHKKTLSCGEVSSRFGSWFLFCKSGFCKKVDDREDSFRANSNQKFQKNEDGASANKSDDNNCSSENEVDDIKCENLGVGIQESKDDFVFCPPKNALILTRCRSAPYRSSSLAAKIWGSPFEPTGIEAVKTEIEAKTEQEPHPCPENAAEESKTIPESSRKLETENANKENNNQDPKGTEGGKVVHPLLLTRCKSEPGRTENLSKD
ncbi:uncharacterized protein [Primulina huaijiensis]|uniref:uncharacterized protein n=1 Tax=Primulina huaijiensis TaxID=1492673 RepID=UPI003CC76B12